MKEDYYEPDFNDLISHEPIYSRQYIKLRKLTSLSPEKILSMSADEASTFINAIQKRMMVRSGWRYNDIKIRTVLVSSEVVTSSPGVSATIEVSLVQTKLR